MNLDILFAKRRKAVMEMPKMEDILRGSIVVVKRYCGKEVRRLIDNYQALKAVMEKISRLNMQRVRASTRGRA